MSKYKLQTDAAGVRDFREMRNQFRGVNQSNPDTSTTPNLRSVLVEIREDVANGQDQFEAVIISWDGFYWQDGSRIKVRNLNGRGFPASREQPERRTAFYHGRMGWCLEYRGDRRYIELLEDLDDATEGTEATPPKAQAAVMRFNTDTGELEIPTDGPRLYVVNRGRGIDYESGTRGTWEVIDGDYHFMPIECDPGGSSSSSSSSGGGGA